MNKFVALYLIIGYSGSIAGDLLQLPILTTVLVAVTLLLLTLDTAYRKKFSERHLSLVDWGFIWFCTLFNFIQIMYESYGFFYPFLVSTSVLVLTLWILISFEKGKEL